jgi:uncharacterized protein YkwD
MTFSVRCLLGALLLATGCTGGLTLPATRDPLPADRPPAPAASTLERQMHDLVNQRRSARGLPQLGWDDGVAAIAREHSQAMASGRRPFSHDGFDQRADRISRLLQVSGLAENVAYDSRTGPDLARLVVEGWIASAGHRQNIDGAFTITGIGAAEARDGVLYFTQIFVRN